MSSFETVSTTQATPAEVFALICDLSKWPLFTGWGPLPGIVEATLPAGGAVGLGSRIQVRNTDGSVHHEVVVAFEPARRYEVRMEVVPPASRLMREIRETVLLEPQEAGTRLVRRFALEPRSFITAPFVWAVSRLLARAVRRHDARVVEELAKGRRGASRS